MSSSVGVGGRCRSRIHDGALRGTFSSGTCIGNVRQDVLALSVMVTIMVLSETEAVSVRYCQGKLDVCLLTAPMGAVTSCVNCRAAF